ncbi:hypothetical protein KFU94_07970 [Chloroflexi bacterium TSY]|nr:hypothetical protein [Chloroflexi bacterium TSY]
MAVLSYPGVYVEEVSSGVRPIAAASTSTPAFVGLAEMGPDDEAKRITSWTEFQKHYGTYIVGSYLAESVFQFFNNGGQQCYIVRVTRSNAETANVTVQNRASTPIDGLKFSAKNKGAWGNYLYLQIEDGSTDPGNEFKISIRRQEAVDVVPEDFLNITVEEVHDDLSMDPNASNYVENVLSQNSNLINAEVLDHDNVQNGFHRGGTGPSPPVGDTFNFHINIDNDGFQLVSLTPTESEPLDNLTVVAEAIQTIVRSISPLKASTDPAAFAGFTCTVQQSGTSDEHLLLTSGTTAANSAVRIQNASTDNAAVSLRLGVGNGGISEDGRAVQRPALADAIQIGDHVDEAPVTAVTRGTDGTEDLTELSYSEQFPLLDNKTQ